MRFKFGFSEIMVAVVVITGLLSIYLLINLPAAGAISDYREEVYDGYWTSSEIFSQQYYTNSLVWEGIVFQAKYKAHRPFSTSEQIGIQLFAYKTWNPNISSITIDYLTVGLMFTDLLQNPLDYQTLLQRDRNITFNLESSEMMDQGILVDWAGEFPHNTKYVGMKLIAVLDVAFTDNTRVSFTDVELVASTPNIPVEDHFVFNHDPFMYILTITMVLALVGSIIFWKSPASSGSWLILVIAGSLCISTLVNEVLEAPSLGSSSQTTKYTFMIDNLYADYPVQADVKLANDELRVDELYTVTLDFNLSFDPNLPLRGYIFEARVHPNRIWGFMTGDTSSGLSQEGIWGTEQTFHFTATYTGYIAAALSPDDNFGFLVDYVLIVFLENGTSRGGFLSVGWSLEDVCPDQLCFKAQILPSLNPP
ncbi:MAG: hypothetical protein ACFFBD_28775, partial [Candidatus Hodarchaeota archaeon]